MSSRICNPTMSFSCIKFTTLIDVVKDIKIFSVEYDDFIKRIKYSSKYCMNIPILTYSILTRTTELSKSY